MLCNLIDSGAVMQMCSACTPHYSTDWQLVAVMSRKEAKKTASQCKWHRFQNIQKIGFAHVLWQRKCIHHVCFALVGNTGCKHNWRKLHKVPLIEMHIIKKESLTQFVPFFYCFLSLNMNIQSVQLMTKSYVNSWHQGCRNGYIQLLYCRHNTHYK